jgi:hypothetical protein
LTIVRLFLVTKLALRAWRVAGVKAVGYVQKGSNTQGF